MNTVHLSGVAESSPSIVSRPGEPVHSIFKLDVAHKTSAGVEKHESYPISGWRGVGERMHEKINSGAHVSIEGYLSQKWVDGVPSIEITVTEFMTTPRSMALVKPTACPTTNALVKDRPVNNQDQMRQPATKEAAVLETPFNAEKEKSAMNNEMQGAASIVHVTDVDIVPGTVPLSTGDQCEPEINQAITYDILPVGNENESVNTHVVQPESHDTSSEENENMGTTENPLG